jgi:hypothetical protein
VSDLGVAVERSVGGRRVVAVTQVPQHVERDL